MEVKDQSGTLVVYGYTAWSLINLKMKIYLNGDYYGDVACGERTREIPITELTKVTIKCFVRSTSIQVLPGKRNEIRAEFDRISGRIIANLQTLEMQ